MWQMLGVTRRLPQTHAAISWALAPERSLSYKVGQCQGPRVSGVNSDPVLPLKVGAWRTPTLGIQN